MSLCRIIFQMLWRWILINTNIGLQIRHCLLWSLCSHIDGEQHSIQQSFLRSCWQKDEPLHSRHLSFILLCAHIWLPLHSKHSYFLLWSQIAVPLHSLHVIFRRPWEQNAEPPQSRHLALTLPWGLFLFFIRCKTFFMSLIIWYIVCLLFVNILWHCI